MRRHVSPGTEQETQSRGRTRPGEPAATVLALQRKIGNRALGAVIQRDWKCQNEECGATGKGRVPRVCPKCDHDELEEVAKKLPFGDWWDSLSDERRQELLRAHGTHEARGGGQQKQKGGGARGKGDQHDTGVATAKKAIKKKYDKGEIE